MRASQQQFGALLRLSMSEGPEERPKECEAIHNSTPGVVASAMASPVIDRPTAPTASSTSYAAFEKPPRSEAPPQRDELNGRAKANAPMDRKSTRLNSSHTVISYAVFCLKKKKKKKNQRKRNYDTYSRVS